MFFNRTLIPFHICFIQIFLTPYCREQYLKKKTYLLIQNPCIVMQSNYVTIFMNKTEIVKLPIIYNINNEE